MFRSLIIFFSSAVILVSCRVQKPLAKPETALPAQFRYSASADTSSIADKAWKDLFADAKLSALIDSGIHHNYDMLLAINRLDISRQRLRQSRLLQLAEVNLQVTGSYSRPSKNSLNGISINSFLKESHVENYQAIASLSWEADIWGKIRSQQEGAAAEYMQSYEAVKAVQTQIVSDISQGYLNLLMLDRQLQIANSNLLLNDSFVLATRKLKDAGMVNQLAVQQAEAQRQSTSLLLPQLLENIAIQENAISVLVGDLPDSIERQHALDAVMAVNDISTGIPAAIVARRPDVKQAELAIVAANARLGVAKANMYPALNITAGGGLESFKSSNWFNIPNSLFGLAAGTIIEPVFRRNQLKTEYRVAKLEREEAVIRFKQSVLQAVGEVSDALASIQMLKEQESVALAQVDTLREAVVNSKKLFSSDLANYLEVLTAQGNALQAELELAAIQRRQASAVIELYRALGGGWSGHLLNTR